MGQLGVWRGLLWGRYSNLVISGEFEEEEELDPRAALAGCCDDASAGCHELPYMVVCCEVVGVQEPGTLQVEWKI